VLGDVHVLSETDPMLTVDMPRSVTNLKLSSSEMVADGYCIADVNRDSLIYVWSSWITLVEDVPLRGEPLNLSGSRSRCLLHGRYHEITG
jgi:hypothetical protein